MEMPTIAAIQSLVKTLTALSSDLPLSIKQGSKSDKIWVVMNTGEGKTLHEIFNRYFDAMFGDDCHDSNGCLEHVRRGKLGLGLVCSYLSKIDWTTNFSLDLVEIKLQGPCSRSQTPSRTVCQQLSDGVLTLVNSTQLGDLSLKPGPSLLYEAELEKENDEEDGKPKEEGWDQLLFNDEDDNSFNMDIDLDPK
ncbi:hypothetical protein H2248_004542 [Termitomyces sp. 'cryptogamus']|nr:hypothetical protein H2248_004542 [Termitomyces sp. 'cryptogamus']